MIANWHLNEWPTPAVSDKPVFCGYVELTDGSVCGVLADSLEAFDDSMRKVVKALDHKLVGTTTL